MQGDVPRRVESRRAPSRVATVLAHVVAVALMVGAAALAIGAAVVSLRWLAGLL